VRRARWNVYLEPEHAERLNQLALRQGVSKSALLAQVLSRYLASGESAEAAWRRRLEQLSRQLEHVERDQTIQIETLALFIRHQLAIAAPLPESHLEAARAQGRARFEQFIDQLARHLQKGGSLVRQVWQEIEPAGEPAASAATNGSPP
jgi:predicted transcriptional regulator